MTQQPTFDGVPVTYVPRSFPKRHFRATALTQVLDAHAADCDLVHVHGCWNFFGWEAARDPITQISTRGIARMVDAVDTPDPETPTGIRGVGEPPVGAAYGAIMNAIADAIGDDAFKRSPVTADILLTSLENGGKRTHETLTAHI